MGLTERLGVMGVSRLVSAVLALLCSLICVLLAGAGPAAAATEFGEEGEHTGQFKSPAGLAVNQATGDVFVSDQYNHRIDAFGGSGSWLRAWGWNVNEENPALELQTCTTLCQQGTAGGGAGTYANEGPRGVAVDQTSGDVYAVDWENYRVEKFDSEGHFILMFGGGVLTAGATGKGILQANSTEVTAVTTESRAFVTGQAIEGTGIPAGTTITGVGVNEGTIFLSKAATISGATPLSVKEGAGNVAVSEQQTITVAGPPTGGTFKLAFTSPPPTAAREETVPISYNAPAAGTGSVQGALEALPNIGPGNVVVSGSAGGPYTVEFTGTRYSDTNVKQMEGNGEDLTPQEAIAVATTVEGHSAAADNVCSKAVDCVSGVVGEKEGPNASSQFKWSYEGSYIAVGPGDNVYVGDQARVQIFEPSGAFKQEISLAGLSSEERVSALAVDAGGDVFVVDGFVGGGVREFEPNGTEKLIKFDENSFSIGAIALDSTGHLYVGDSEPSFHILKYDVATGEALASFGANTIAGYTSHGMAFANAAGELYVTGASLSSNEPRVFAFTPPPPGPLIESHGESGTPGKHGEAKLEAEINAEGHETTYKVEYITEEQFNADGETYGVGTETEAGPSSITTGLFEDHPVEVKLPEAKLVPGTTYHWRFVATDSLSQKTMGPDKTLEELPLATVDGPWATGVTSTSATLAARIDPEGTGTSYSLQYGTSTAYEHEFTGNVGAGSAFVAVGGYYIQGLTPGMTYHYRVVTVNECTAGKTCTQDGADHTFTTRPPASEFVLPDGREWELVTPANTKAAVLEYGATALRQAAGDGSAINYPASGTLGENALSNSGANVLSRRGPKGWVSQDISAPQSVVSVLNGQRYLLFSPDLASALFRPQTENGVLSADALKGTVYVRNNLTCGETPTSCYTPLLSTANTPPGTELEQSVLQAGSGGVQKQSQASFIASTLDLTHVVLGSPLPLTAEAHEYTPPNIAHGYGNLFEWGAGRLQLVSVLPSGKTDESNEARLAGQAEYGQGQAARVLSNDGRRVAWTVGSRYGPPGASQHFKALYVRDMAEGKTVHLGGLGAYYQTMSSDGSRVFFLEHGELYEYHVVPGVSYDAGTTIDLTASHGPGEASAGVQELVTDVSEDGSYAYFVAKGVLSSARNVSGEKALAGGDNLYVLHNEGGTWEAPRFIARLSSEDEKSWSFHNPNGYPELGRVTSRVSPDGRYLAFMSSRPLTGYDNVDLNLEAKGAHDEEVFLYHAPPHPASESGSLICASCDPSGARPHGVSGATTSIATSLHSAEWAGHWLAGNLTGWAEPEGGAGEIVYQPRYLSDSGRLFFNSPIALVSHDTNGLEDVYQYEPAGPGGVNGCTNASATYNAHTDGCVDLISSGQSASESAFMDASENGNDVFFLTSDRLTATDIDTGYDVWDAHVCSASSPCVAPHPSPPPCSEESCRGAATPQPELFGAPPSATFSGTGNVLPAPAPVVSGLTRAQKLSRALSSCRTKYRRSKKRRAACERAAHKLYGHAAKRLRKANAIKRGDR